VLAVIVVSTVFVMRSGRTSSAEPRDAALPLVAVGHVAGYGTDSSARTMAGPVSDLLATSLSRVSGLRVVSQGRMLELMRLRDGARDTSGAGFIEAARQAGATQVIDGTLYALPAGGLRLDLRQVDVKSGAIGKAHVIEGNNLFALVDSGTARLVAALGRDAPAGSVTDVTTTSVMAYRMYAEGLRAYYRADYQSAMNLFDAALREDSLFALAAYQGALATSAAGLDDWFDRMQRAKELASRATERERLAITADWAFRLGAASLRAVAETLTTRFPAEVGGHLALGVALLREGEFAASRAELQRAVTMDSAVIRSGQVPCTGCEALRALVSALILTDSLDAAGRAARWWIKLQPTSVDATTTLISVLDREGRAAEVDSIYRTADLPYDVTFAPRTAHLVRVRDYPAADQMLEVQTRQTSRVRQADAYWTLAISLREQGRLDRALDAARNLRRFPDLKRKPGGPHSASIIEAQIELEQGRAGAAAALFDTVARLPLIQSATPPPRVWPLAQAFAARITAGDTARAEQMIDSMRTLGAHTGSARDARFFHHLRGLLQAARGRDAEAIEEFRAAVYSLTDGYTRTSYELARAYVRSGRPREAVAVLRPALHAALDGSALYVNRTELHELLAKAWEDAGVRDSAAANYALVARVWAAGDPPFKARAENARQRAASLSRRPPPA
jgi:tetratricopeptide (TPR) repeat protein/TolB-like protein